MRIPEVRAELLRWASSVRMFGFQFEPAELATVMEAWAEELKRKPRATDAPVTSAPMTAALRARIRALHEAEPALTQHEIAKRLGTNQGRVSETLAGKRR